MVILIILAVDAQGLMALNPVATVGGEYIHSRTQYVGEPLTGVTLTFDPFPESGYVFTRMHFLPPSIFGFPPPYTPPCRINVIVRANERPFEVLRKYLLGAFDAVRWSPRVRDEKTWRDEEMSAYPNVVNHVFGRLRSNEGVAAMKALARRPNPRSGSWVKRLPANFAPDPAKKAPGRAKASKVCSGGIFYARFLRAGWFGGRYGKLFSGNKCFFSFFDVRFSQFYFRRLKPALPARSPDDRVDEPLALVAR